MDTSVELTSQVSELYVKLAHGAAMTRVPYLDLDPVCGIVGDVNPAGRSPRQVCLASEETLLTCDIKPDRSRANIVLRGPIEMASGSILIVGEAAIRVTLACEPCAHGARLAEAPMREFRRIGRFLGVVTRKGRSVEGAAVAVRHGVFAGAPEDFRSRARWALEFIPPGRAVTSLEFLNAIGAGRAHLRALPRWLRAASASGGPSHRVLTAQMQEPSWAPGAYADLAAEGGSGTATEPFALVDVLWFADSGPA